MTVEKILQSNNAVETLDNVTEFLRGEFEVDEFKKVLQKLTTLEFRNEITSEGVDLTPVCESIRELLLQLTIDSGNLPEIADLNVFNLFINAQNLKQLAKIDNNLNGLPSLIERGDITQLESVFVIILECYLGMLNGDALGAFGKFIRRVSTLHLHQASSAMHSGVLIDIFQKIDLSPEQFMQMLRPLFDKDSYFKLSPMQRRSIFNWCLHGFWQYHKLFSHGGWTQFYDAWKELLYEHIARDECDQAMYLQFFIYHVMGNSFQEVPQWREFNESISRKTSAYYIDWARRHNLPSCKSDQSDGKKLIGILRDRIVANSPFKVEWSVLNKLMNDEEFTSKYRVVIYNMDYVEKSESQPETIKMYTDLNIPIVNVCQHLYSAGYYFSHLEKALLIRDKIIADGVDILIHGAAYDINDFIVATRAAPKQIFWSHGNFEYDIPNIDKRISHISAVSHMKQSDYAVEHFAYKTNEIFTKPDEDRYKEIAKTVRAKYPQDAVMLGSIGRMVKVDSEPYLEAVGKIMQECPNTIYLACGGGNIERIKEKLPKYGIDESRFVFEGFVDPHIYGYVIDVYLDTFPERGGESVVEFFEKVKHESGRDRFLVQYFDELSKYISLAISSSKLVYSSNLEKKSFLIIPNELCDFKIACRVDEDTNFSDNYIAYIDELLSLNKDTIFVAFLTKDCGALLRWTNPRVRILSADYFFTFYRQNKLLAHIVPYDYFAQNFFDIYMPLSESILDITFSENRQKSFLNNLEQLGDSFVNNILLTIESLNELELLENVKKEYRKYLDGKFVDLEFSIILNRSLMSATSKYYQSDITIFDDGIKTSRDYNLKLHSLILQNKDKFTMQRANSERIAKNLEYKTNFLKVLD